MSLEPGLEIRYVQKILANWIEERISTICTSPTQPMHPS
jgi:DNA replication protein DnaD